MAYPHRASSYSLHTITTITEAVQIIADYEARGCPQNGVVVIDEPFKGTSEEDAGKAQALGLQKSAGYQMRSFELLSRWQNLLLREILNSTSIQIYYAPVEQHYRSVSIELNLAPLPLSA